jgi:hypothetical protein
MTVRQMTADLMEQCLDDAERLVRERWGSPPSRDAAVTLAAALFEARWQAGIRRLYEAVMGDAHALDARKP